MSHCNYAGIGLLYAPASTVTNCKVSQISGYYGILVEGTGATVQGCTVSQINGGSGGNGTAIVLSAGSVARQNTLSSTLYGVYGGKYQDNLTTDCTYPVSNGTDAGGNN